MPDRAALPAVGRVGLIGNFPPRRCGIATFTSDLREALAAARPEVEYSTLAMTDPGESYAYPPEVNYEIRQDMQGDYRAAAEILNAGATDVVSLQHEFGIFGGPAGNYLLALLRNLRPPVVTTFHTVLTSPDADQLRALSAIFEMSSRIVVMAEKGRAILASQGFPAAKIAVIPHGIPDLPFLDPAFCKDRYGLDGGRVLMTFGLLGRNKGIETMIKALPDVVRDHPDVTYVVLGATHPHQIAREGESYRCELKTLAEELGVADHVRFVNEYVSREEMLAYLTAADLYVTPYIEEAQITSGTLAYSAGLGKAVVSTPYWYAREILADGRGELVPFADPEAMSSIINALLSDEPRRHRMRRKAYAAGRGMVWQRAAELYFEQFALARAFDIKSAANVVRLRSASMSLPQPSLEAVAHMTDSCGIYQHCISNVPDRNHGYCLDDNARALILMNELEGAKFEDPRIADLTRIYTAFVSAAWNDANGRFRNFMSYDRRWLEDQGSDDSFGRGLWAVGSTVASTRDHGLKLWATRLADKVIAEARQLTSLRSRAFMILGLTEFLDVYPGHRHAADSLTLMAEDLHLQLREARTPDWQWFEEGLAYDNARLPEALIRAGIRLKKRQWINDGLEALSWLMQIQTGPNGHFRPVGTSSFGLKRQLPLPFDQQPLEAWASAAACETAHSVTGDWEWVGEAKRAFSWFLGDNDLNVRLAAPGGGCYDGLLVNQVNLNQGAESILAYQLALCVVTRLPATAVRGLTAKDA